jgi:hypothetical protein
MRKFCLVLLAFGLLSATALASPSIIDFENFNLNGGLFLDTPDTLQFMNAGGSAVNVTINGGSDLRIYNLALFGGYTFPGPQALIDMNWNTFTNPIGTDILFSSDVSDFSLIAGDFGSDDDSPLRIEAFNAAGSSLGVTTAAWPATSFPPLALLSLNVSGIRRIHYSSGGSFPGSTFIDNLTFTAAKKLDACSGRVDCRQENPASLEVAVPEPITASLTLLGLATVCWLRLRRRELMP